MFSSLFKGKDSHIRSQVSPSSIITFGSYWQIKAHQHRTAVPLLLTSEFVFSLAPRSDLNRLSRGPHPCPNTLSPFTGRERVAFSLVSAICGWRDRAGDFFCGPAGFPPPPFQRAKDRVVRGRGLVPIAETFLMLYQVRKMWSAFWLLHRTAGFTLFSPCWPSVCFGGDGTARSFLGGSPGYIDLCCVRSLPCRSLKTVSRDKCRHLIDSVSPSSSVAVQALSPATCAIVRRVLVNSHSVRPCADRSRMWFCTVEFSHRCPVAGLTWEDD